MLDMGQDMIHKQVIQIEEIILVIDTQHLHLFPEEMTFVGLQALHLEVHIGDVLVQEALVA